MKQIILSIILMVLIFGSFQPITQISEGESTAATNLPIGTESLIPSSDSGVVISNTPYVILELQSGSIPARGTDWSNLLDSMGIYNIILSTSDLLSNPIIIEGAPAIIVDGSLGSSNGDQVSTAVLNLLIQVDVPIILTGSSVFLLHHLTDRGPPSQTAPVATSLFAVNGYSGAVFLSRPNNLTIGSSLSTESSLLLPVYETQTPMSRIVNLTGSATSTVAPLRYDSYPLELFLFAYQEPLLLTPDGKGFFENVVAFSTAIRESSTSIAIASHQTPFGRLLAGGFHYLHSPSVSSSYYAVHSAQSLLSGSGLTNWIVDNRPLVKDILNELLIDYGSETGFMTSKAEAIVNCQSTAQGLFLICCLDLSADYPVGEIVTYLSLRQSIEGGFENHITITYHVIEALFHAGYLDSIDTDQLESWLRDLVIDGTKTSDPNLWGAIGPNPTSTAARTNYAVEYLQSLAFIGKAHLDPSKLTSWILTRTSNGDGSFRNSISVDEEVITGTASALTCMEMLGTLNQTNRTASLTWLSNNQLGSGGFGMKSALSDFVAKFRETFRVALCLSVLGETTSPLSIGILGFIDSVTTDISFESMDMLSSLMWTSYLLETSRLAHASPLIDLKLAKEYLNRFETMTIYPYWKNLTTTSAPEYVTSQYRTKSVWIQYFGVSSAASLGIVLDPAVVSDILFYISQSQYITGHYRPTSFTGTAHMQHSVAAIETLYLLYALDTIRYRSSLEAAVLSEYQSGKWSTVGWTLEPFAGSQEMIDFLSTRAALRLGVLTPSMVSEITSTIEARIQYNDLMALSMDVSTLALLQSSDLSASVDFVDSSFILNTLRSSHFNDGWFNSTKTWQPLFTQSVLRMVSILGLRPLLSDTSGTVLSATSNSIVELGSVYDISISITSSIETHSVVVSAFGQSTLFRNVADSDTISLNIPSYNDSLGLWDISLMVVDWGASRAFEKLTVTVEGRLEGFLDLETPLVKMGEFVNATTFWTLAGGEDAGLSQITVRLGEPPIYHQWTYEETSPLSISVPSVDFDAGLYSFTVTIAVPHCDSLILSDYVIIAEPNPTYIQAPSEIDGLVGDDLSIDWSLCFQENGTIVSGQMIILSIIDSNDEVVHTDQMVSGSSVNSFSWIADARGDFSFVLVFSGNNTLDESQVRGIIHVFENTIFTWNGTGLRQQYSSCLVTMQLTTQNGELLEDQGVHITITSPSAIMILDTTFVANSTGHVSFMISLSENGIYLLQANFEGNGFLLSCSDSSSITSWSTSTLNIGGVVSEEILGDTNSIWASLIDSAGYPIIGRQITIKVILLPSTVVKEQSLITNSSGLATMQWTASSTGLYQLEAIFDGTLSRSSALDTFDFEVLVPVTLSISYYTSPEVGVLGWIRVLATNHLSNPISGLTITLTVQAPNGVTIYSNVSTTSSGIALFTWTPSMRGLNTILINSEKQNWYQQSAFMVYSDVLETPVLQVIFPVELIAPVSATIEILLLDNLSNPIDVVTIHTTVFLNSLILYDSYDVTSASGQVNLFLTFSEPGLLIVDVELSSQGWLIETSTTGISTVTAATTISITIPGMPIEQGSSLGVVVTLLGYSSSPLVEAHVEVFITLSNGTAIGTYYRVTDTSGRCIFAHTFNSVGDFLIHAYYHGYGLNSSASDSVVQRVFTIPNIRLTHNPSCIIEESIAFQIALVDSLGEYIDGRIIQFTIKQYGVVVFEAQTQSINGFSIITWYPSKSGLSEVIILHLGNSYYLTNLKTSSLSVLELVSGTLDVSRSQIDLFESTTFVYTLIMTSPRAGISIHFEVLGMDLVPVWSVDVLTNISGVAKVIYTANEAQGVLYVNAGPLSDEFLIGGGVQESLIVVTECQVVVSMNPCPPTVNSPINITIEIEDELGEVINGISVIVSAYDPYGQQIKLGLWTNSITVVVEDGVAIVHFTPSMVGLFSVTVTSSGAISVHGFTWSTHHIIYSTTQLQLILSTHDLEVGQTLEVSACLFDYKGDPMVGRNVSFMLDGPGTGSIGPVLLITNSTGYVKWSVEIDGEGLWLLDASFVGLGVYLPAHASEDINVKYGTVVQLSLITTDDIIAGVNNASFSVLLEDSGGTPLEGFTLHYEIYHETLGLINQGNIIQSGTEPMVLSLTFDKMGSFTLIVSFSGTSHYHASNAAIELWVFGTTEVVSICPEKIDRADERSIVIQVEDEASAEILLEELDILIEVEGPAGLVDLTSRLLWNTSFIEIFTISLPIGHYTLMVTIAPNSERIGCIKVLVFDIVSSITIEVDSGGLSGVISTPHTLLFFLRDSLDELVDVADVWVSLYDPLGREIYGHPLSTRTLVTSSLLGTEVSWTPTLTGEYRVLLDFEGDMFYNSSTVEVFILVRYSSKIELEAPELIEYGGIVPVSITLTGAIGGLSGKSVSIAVSMDGIIEQEMTIVTGRRGIVSHNLVGLLAGSHTITVTFLGSDTQAPCINEVVVMVSPVVVIVLEDDSTLNMGRNCTINLSLSVLGTNGNWTGLMEALLLNPDHEEVGIWLFKVNPYSVLSIDFFPTTEGTYLLNITILGLPLLVEQTYPLAIVVMRESLQFVLDAGSAPLVGGFGVLSVVGFIVRKKMKCIVESLPGEWTE